MSDEFKSPYDHIDVAQKKRIVGDVSIDDFAFIRGLCLESGVQDICVATMWRKLVAGARLAGIRDHKDRERFERFVVECVVSVPDWAPVKGKRAK